MTSTHRDDFLAQGKTMSYVCHDVVNFLSARDLQRAARDIPPLAPRYLGPHYDLGFGFTLPVSPEGCESWNVGRAPRSQHRPSTGGLPTLILGGEYDMGMPPFVERQMDDRLTDAHYYEFPASDHLQLANLTNGHVCAREIAAAFLTDPEAALDSSCIGELPQADFTPTAVGRRQPRPWHLRSRP